MMYLEFQEINEHKGVLNLVRFDEQDQEFFMSFVFDFTFNQDEDGAIKDLSSIDVAPSIPGHWGGLEEKLAEGILAYLRNHPDYF